MAPDSHRQFKALFECCARRELKRWASRAAQEMVAGGNQRSLQRFIALFCQQRPADLPVPITKQVAAQHPGESGRSTLAVVVPAQSYASIYPCLQVFRYALQAFEHSLQLSMQFLHSA
jgi:hypothetical protein